MRKFSQLSALLLAVLLCLCACGQQPEPAVPVTETQAAAEQADQALVGTWVMAREMEFEDVKVSLELCMAFGADGAVQQYFSESSVKKVSEAVFDQRFGELDQAELDKTLKEEGYESLEAYMEALQKAVEDYFGGSKLDAFWRSREGKIILYKSLEDYRADQPGEQDMRDYRLSEDGKTLTILYPEGDMVFKKA